jgi:hypothetical protein
VIDGTPRSHLEFADWSVHSLMSDEEVVYALRWNNDIASSLTPFDSLVNEAPCWTSLFSSDDFCLDIIWVQSVAFTTHCTGLSARWSSTSLWERGNDKLVFSWSCTHSNCRRSSMFGLAFNLCSDIKLRTLIEHPDKTVVTNDISLPRCEFYLVKVLRDCLFFVMPDSIFWSFPCNVRRIGRVLHWLHFKLTPTLGFAPAVCDVVPTEPPLAD